VTGVRRPFFRDDPAGFLKAHVAEDVVTGCWLWTGGRANGYGSFNTGRRNYLAHRVSYETFVGPIPSGLTIDHLCRVKTCINPVHLEAVTSRTNTLRASNAPAAINAAKTHCNHGHQFDEANTSRSGGKRNCRKCDVAKSMRYQARLKAAL
jgi:hypothetical protein